MSNVSHERDEDFFVNVIKLVLFGLSRKSFDQDIINKVIDSIKQFLFHISQQIFQNKEFSAFHKKHMQSEIQVYYMYTYIYM